MFCTNCGNRLQEGAAFCSGCRTAVSTDSSKHLQHTGVQPGRMQSECAAQPSTQRNKQTYTAIFVIIGALLIGGGILTWWLIGGNETFEYELSEHEIPTPALAVPAPTPASIPQYDEHPADDYISEPYAAPPVAGIDLTPELSSLRAFLEFLMSPQPLISEWEWVETLHWNLEDVRHAALLDFDNDGIPELILTIYDDFIFEWAPELDFEHRRVVIVSYTGQAEIIYHSNNFGHVYEGWGGYYLAFSSYGQNYMSYYYSYSDISQGKSYFALSSGEWIQVLTGTNLGYYMWYINEDEVSEAEFYNAPSDILGITHYHWLRHADDNVHHLIDYINSRLAEASLPPVQ